MADIEVVFSGDDAPLRGVIGRLSRDLINFAKNSEAAFGGSQRSLDNLTKASSEYSRTLDKQVDQLVKLQKASRIESRGSSSFGFDDKQIRQIQGALGESTREASKFADELKKASTTRLPDEQIRVIQVGLSESVNQARLLSQEFGELSAKEQSSVNFISQKVGQYDLVLQRQRDINKTLDERLSKSKAIELAAKPQSADTSSGIGLTVDQVRKVQAALASSTSEARELREEFLRQNKALEKGTALVKRQGSELEVSKKSSGEIVKRSTDIVKYLGDAARGAGEFAKESGAAEKIAFNLADLWESLGNFNLPALRYALYDISNTARDIAVASGAFAAGPIIASIKYEREFANVIRTNELAGDSTRQLREQLQSELREISQTTPISWADVTNIAALAGQLGVAQSVIGRFTESVAKFSATTDLTVDAAATAFGRLDQLIDGVDGKFENLGSAILAVGVDSVATESQIVNVSTQIASMGNLAGLTAPEIVGLSGAIASLGVRPELARGTVLKLFSEIGKSAAEGGFEIEKFATLTGRTSEEFIDDWGSEPGEVLQDFFDGINAEGPRAEQTLRSLGITTRRDIPTILRLAQNSDEVRRLIALSNEEYLTANKITEQYGIISGTTSEQLARLGQNFTTLAATVGDSVGPLALVVQLANNVVEGFTAIAASPGGQFFSFIAIAAAAVVTALTTLIASFTGAVAASLALKFAMTQLGITINRETIGALLRGGKALDVLTGASTKSAVAIRFLSASLRLLTIASGVFGLIVVAVGLFGQFASKSEEASEKVERLFGDLSSLRTALEEDAEAFNETTKKMEDGSEALGVYSGKVQEATESLSDIAKRGKDLADGNEEQKDAVEKTTEAIKEQNDALEENAEQLLVAADSTREYFRDQLKSDDEIIFAFGDENFQEAFKAEGLNIDDLIDLGIQGGDIDAKIDPIIDRLRQKQIELQGERLKISLLDFDSTEEMQAAVAAIEQESDALEATIVATDVALRNRLDAQDDAIAITAQEAEGLEALSGAQEEVAAKANLSGDEISNLNNLLFEEANFLNDVESAFGGYAKALEENADDANSFGGEIQNVIEAITNVPGGSTDVILANLVVLLQFLQAQGPQTAAAQAVVEAAIDEVGNAAGEAAPKVVGLAAAEQGLASFDIASISAIFSDAMADVGSSAGGAAKEVKTLAEEFDELLDSIFDPVNAAQDQASAIADLGKSYAELGKNAFFASDEVQDAVRAITDNAESPEQAVANLQAVFGQLARTVGSETDPSLQFLRNTINRVAAEFGIAASEVAEFANVDLSFFQAGVESVQEEVRTLLDFGSDLDNVISRAFDIRYADILQIDNIADAWQDLADRVDDARESIDELKASQQDLSADRSIKEYFLSVAESYGDTLRAAQLRKELAELDREQAENARELRQQQLIAGGDLSGDEPASRESRGALLELVQEYQQYIVTLAESGASQDELREATAKARKEFVAQARELGFQESVVLEYAQAFDDVTFAINNVPRDITVDANVNPALQALNELNAKLNDSIDLAERLNQVQGQPNPSPSSRNNNRSNSSSSNEPIRGLPGRPSAPTDSAGNPSFGSIIRASTVNVKSPKATITDVAGPGDRPGESRTAPKTLFDFDDLFLYSSGGFTGRGGKFDPAGIVHKGEFVVPKQFVNQSTGLPDAGFLAQLQNGLRGFANGGFVGGTGGGTSDGVMMVELSPFDRKLLQDAGNVQLRVNGRVVAEATNDSNRNQARRGAS